MKALEGLKVLDLTTTLSGAHASLLFADNGAEVVLVEPPGGNPLRSQPAAPFWLRGKKSIELDLADGSDRDVARGLALDADVLIETWRPGVAERLGLGYDGLAADNPGLVFGSITGFGRRGPYAHLKGYEGVVQAKIGTFGPLHLSRRPGPSFCATSVASFGSAQTLNHGLLAALYERETTGRGQRVETTLWQAMTAHDCWNWLIRLVAARYPEAFTAVPRVAEERPVPNGWLSFRLLVGLSKDGRWMQFSQTSERLWLAFMRVLDLEWMLTDPEWKDRHSDPDIDKREAYWEKLLEAVRAKTVAEWYEVFDQEPDVFAELFRTGSELLHHPQIVHDGQAVTVEDPKLGPVLQPGALVKMTETPSATSVPAPALDEHGAELRTRPRPTTQTPPARTLTAPQGSPPLAGVRVVELGTFYAGPYGATVLADLGATVIKVEQLDGDPMRTIVPFPEVGGVKVLGGKRSVAVDIHSPEGREIVYELVRRADIVLRSFRAGVAERLGYGPEDLLRVNPDLIYLNAPGFGVDGPYGHRPAYAPTIGAGAGQASRNLGPTFVQRADLTLDEVKAGSVQMGGAVMSGSNPDANSALAAATGMLVGLLARRRGAPGQSMLTSMLCTAAHVLSDDMVEYEGRAPAPTVDEGIHGFGPLYRLYEAADGTWVFLAAPTEREWPALAATMELDTDGRFATAAGRQEHAEELATALQERFRRRAASAWEAELTAVDVACVAAANGPSEAVLLEGDQAIARMEGQVVQLEHPVIGEYPRLKALVAFSRSGGTAQGSPLCGQDTDAVLAELGYSEEAVADLRTRGILGS
ncbi:MAG TPA: CoA transferase [Acidimicrobiales bacterium]|nr:CoA transferase [Acidimicrobiales bacterium]